MAKLLTVSFIDLAPGTYNRSVAIPANANAGYRVTLTRVAWPSGPCATIVATMAGVGFSFMRTVKLVGGDARGRGGAIATTSAFSQEWPGFNSGTGNRVKQKPATLDLAITIEQLLSTTVTIESL